MVLDRDETEARPLLIVDQEGVIGQSCSNILALEFILVAVELSRLLL